jgi:hypothetical protein
MRRVRVGLALVLAAAAFTALAPAGAEAKACGSVRVNGSEYVVGGAKASCRFMRRWSRSMVKRSGRPRGWDCHRRRTSGGCTKHTGARVEPFFVYYPPD